MTIATENRIEASAYRSQLMTLADEGRTYPFINAAYHYLAQVLNDPEITMLVIKELARIGLGGPARELVQNRQDLKEAGVDVAALRRQLAAVPTGRVPWTQFTEQFEANLNVLSKSDRLIGVDTETLRRALADVQLFQSETEQVHLSTRQPGKLRRWLGVFTDCDEIREAELGLDEGLRTTAMLALALNDLAERVYESTQNDQDQAQSPMYILEPRVERLAAWLSVNDRVSILGDPRVYIVAGDTCLDDFVALLRGHEDLALPNIQFASDVDGQFRREVSDAVVSLQAERSTLRDAVCTSLRARHQSRVGRDWADRLRPGATIVGYSSQFTTMLQYSMRDIGHALEKRGYRFVLKMEAEPHRAMNSLTIARDMDEYDPALVILINHLRREEPTAFGDVPILTWVQDPVETILSDECGASIGPHDFLCGYYRTKCSTSHGYPADQYFSAPLPVSTRVFHDGPVEDAVRRQYACDIMYVGHLHDLPEETHRKWLDKTSPNLHALIDDIFNRLVELHESGQPMPDVHGLVRSLAEQRGIHFDGSINAMLAEQYARRLFDTMYRRQSLHWVADWATQTNRSFRLYGRGWDRDEKLAPFASGEIEHGEPLRCAYHSASLVLQTLPTGFTHQRSYEGIASGSQVITRYAPHMFRGLTPEEFVQADPASVDPGTQAVWFPDLHRVVFRDKQELGELCERLLSDTKERQELWSSFHAIVKDQYTYDGVVPGLIDQVRHGLRRSSDARNSPAPEADATV